MGDYKELYEILLKEFNQYVLESIKWSVEDFTTYEKEGYQISEEDAQIALEKMIHSHDCNYGITWDSVDYYITLCGDRVEKGTELWRTNLQN